MEVTHESHVDEINEALDKTGRPTGVMLQIGTRNTQNFELLKSVGRQQEFPVLFKRGFGITLDESLHAAEYLASEGNQKVVFGLRGMKTNIGDPHRNMVDFAHIPVVKRLTRMPVCIDPSHSVGGRFRSSDNDSRHHARHGAGRYRRREYDPGRFSPGPAVALVDGPQALRMEELPPFLEDVRIVREAYEKRAGPAFLTDERATVKCQITIEAKPRPPASNGPESGDAAAPVGFTDEDFDKPIIGVANGYSTITPCNLGLGKLADAVIETA